MKANFQGSKHFFIPMRFQVKQMNSPVIYDMAFNSIHIILMTLKFLSLSQSSLMNFKSYNQSSIQYLGFNV